MTSYKIVFFGTPDFAVPSLNILSRTGHKVQRVVTQPDRKKGRGRKLAPPPVKSAARSLGYKVLQPASIRDAAFIEEMKRLAPDFFIVVAFGRILPGVLLELPQKGAVNVHASLLPKYRGSAPIQWAIINGETKTGVTTMLLDTGMDTGEMLLQRETTIGPDDTAATLHDRLSEMGASLLMDTLKAYAADAVTPIPQNHDQATLAPMLKKIDGRIDWRMPAAAIDLFVRGMNPWPGAFTLHDGRRIKIYTACPLHTEATAVPGTVIKGFADELRVATGTGVLSILELQGESGKRLPVRKFLQGCPMPPGTRFT